MIADFHCHSHYSDGIYSPSEVVGFAHEAGCEMLALTDHDTIDGISEAQHIAQQKNITLIQGCEISALYNDMTIHIVALGIDSSNTILGEGLQFHQKLRNIRAENIATFLEEKGISNVMEQVKEYAPKKMITRTHFARMLIDKKICSSMGEVFGKYLGNSVTSVYIKWASMNEVIHWITEAGGIAVLAHPLRYKISKAQLRTLVREFSEAGGRAVETITSSTHNNQINHMMSLGHQNNLLFSRGSDFHGDNTYAKIGYLKRIQHQKNIEHALSR